MALPPEVPKLEAAKFPEAPWLGRLWALLQPFFTRTSEAMRAGLTHGRAGEGYQPGNLLAYSRDVPVPAGATFPLSFAHPLTQPARGVVVWGVRLADSPDSPVGGAGVSVDWQNASEGGSSVVRIRALTGLDSTKAYVVTLAVYGG